MKTIGIIIRDIEIEDIEYFHLRKDVFSVFLSYDVKILFLPIVEDFIKLKEIVSLCDGIVLSGGSKCISNDYLLVKYLYDNDIPTLGICLGMQSMAMTYNGQKEGHVMNHQSKDEYVHKVLINKKSKLYKILHQEEIMVNSRHNDCILETNFLISAVSEDRVIEAIEDSQKKFFIGVQWHPESTLDQNSKALFHSFIKSL